MKSYKRYIVFPFLLASLQICSFAQNDGSSLGDMARKIREKQAPAPVSVSSSDAKQLFSEMDTIFNFASSDTGYPKHVTVKRRLLNRSELDQMYKTAWSKSEGFEERINNSELVMKKFGFLPRDFEMSSFLEQNVTRHIGGLYRYDDKTMYLMNWIPMEQQRSIMAHELTHALQDQNYDLNKFMGEKSSNKPSLGVTAEDASEQSTARRAVVEGQATLVLMDHMIEQFMGKKELDHEAYMEAMQFLQHKLQDYESPVSLKNAPLIFSATEQFPYREGLAFEVDAVRRSRSRAFAGMFAHPPRSTYEILEPDAYFEGKKPPVVLIPDLSSVLGDKYEPYDSGSIGEFEIQVMAKEFGRDNDIYTVAQKWNGGSYIVAKQKNMAENSKVTTKDLALLYVSHWRSSEGAVRFTELYRKSLAKHLTISNVSQYNSTCRDGDDECKGLSSGAFLETDEGPVSIEVWGRNTVLISQSFSRETLSKLRPLVLSPNKTKASNVNPAPELHQKLYEIDEFTALQETYATDLIRELLSIK